MGEPVSVIEKPSGRHGYVRFETNRTFTGMGHETYRVGEDIYGDRPPDELARQLFETGKVDEVHVYAQMVTVKLRGSADPSGLADIIGDLHTYYRPGVEVPTPESFAAES
jgi:hypothetical protein